MPRNASRDGRRTVRIVRVRPPLPKEAVRSWTASLLAFAAMILLVSPPTPSAGGRRVAGGEEGGASARSADGIAALKSPAPPPPPALVECALTTPHSSLPHPSEIANGTLRVTVRPDLSPRASSAFLGLVNSGYYDGTYVFRVVPGFVAQWGVRPGWTGDRPQRTGPSNPPDPFEEGKSLSNVRGTLSFAGGNPALGQVFVNLGDNGRLDGEGGEDANARPFATLDSASMHLADRLYAGYKAGMGQIAALRKGDQAVREKFPNMSRIERCREVSAAALARHVTTSS